VWRATTLEFTVATASGRLLRTATPLSTFKITGKVFALSLKKKFLKEIWNASYS
jgi:hypothetical protein